MLWFHPLLAASTTLLAFYVLCLGLVRLHGRHFGGTRHFHWKRHVRLGSLVMALWLLSFAGGALMVWLHWPEYFLKGGHSKGALNMLALMFLGLGTGWYMDRWPRQRVLLPLLHAAINIWLLVLALGQAVSGWGIVQKTLLH
ncbi:MAG: DUF4079 domain-containing protein [Desulfovibrio sp.]